MTYLEPGVASRSEHDAAETGRPADPEGYESASAFGTFGELLQGALPDDLDFLVTLPIARWSTAWFRWDPAASEVRVRPAHKTKSRRLAQTMLRCHGRSGGGDLLLDSELPEGKGMASSSADLVAAARAVGQAFDAHPEPAEIETLLRRIEPSDGVMHHGVVAFHHRQVSLRAHLGHLPPMTVVAIDEGGVVDTMSFNERPKVFSARQKRTYERLLSTLALAIEMGDAAGIGEVATLSALLNQRLCPKRRLDQMIEVSEEVGGVGVVAAHSGTALGILLADDLPHHCERLERARRACATLSDTVWVDHCLPGSWAGRRSGMSYLPSAEGVEIEAENSAR